MFGQFLFILGCLSGGIVGQNRPPSFLPGGDMRNFALSEDTAVGTSVYTLKGEDPEKTTVTYSISGDFLSVERNTGVVTLVKKLDRETKSSIETIITVTDGELFGNEANTVPLRLNIPIVDVNDNRPQFQGTPYKFLVSEAATPGATLFSDVEVTDADAGKNAEIKLFCVEEETPEACQMFQVREARVDEGTYIGVVSLLRPVDYEERTNYKLMIRAEDGGALFSTTVVEVSVTDVQDRAPILLNAPYSASIAENSKPGTSILDIRARDGDLGDAYPLKFTIEEDYDHYFELKNPRTEENGVMVVSLTTSENTLDREHPNVLNRGGIYSFYVKAEELGGTRDSTRAKIIIVVTDRDDKSPMFSASRSDVYVSENIADGTPLPGLNLLVTDEDAGKNAKFSLSLESNQDPTSGLRNNLEIFEVFPKDGIGRTPVIIKVLDGSALDFENPSAREFSLNVIVKQHDRVMSSSLVLVHVKDANDNSPVFGQSEYRVSVSEAASVGSSVANIIASDADSDVFGAISYSLRGFGAEKFYVNDTSGLISIADCGLRSESCLDYELQKMYSLTYSASDGGGKVTSVSLIIDVGDSNDNPPSFDNVEYRRTVGEGATSFEPPLFIKATDVDGENQGGGIVTYEIRDGNTNDQVFSINQQTGQINIGRPLSHIDTPSSIYTLTIRATDKGIPPRHSDVRVLVTVGRDKNRPPRFNKQAYFASIPENSKPGTKVVTVKARDPDGLDNAIRYMFGSSGADYFELHPITGVITVAPDSVLDRDAQKDFKLIVIALDGGKEVQQSTETVVNVSLIDVNNKAPKFKQNSYIGHVNERSANGEIVLKVEAFDLDVDSKLVYSVTDPIFAYDKTGVKLQENSSYDFAKAFSINEKTGEMYVSGKLAHNEAAVIVLNVLVRDENADGTFPVQNDTAEVTLYIQVFSDKNPIFVSPWTPSRPILRFQLKEEQPTGKQVFSVAAKDPVSGRQVRRYEKISGSDVGDFFSVDPLTGQVSLKKNVDYETSETKELRFEVLAIAGDRASQASVVVEIEDVNDNSPQFSETEYHTRIQEDTRWPDEVLTVSARDADEEANGDVLYSLAGDYKHLFEINNTTGSIRVAKGAALDRESSPVVTLQVTASDAPKGTGHVRRSTVNVIIELLDVNDEPPRWTENGVYTAVVPENRPVGSVVTSVSAHDPDLGVNGVIKYRIPELQDIGEYFEIDPNSGVIKVKSNLSGKGRTEPYHLSIRALDGGNPPQFSEAQVTLFVGDVSLNDGIPMFIRPTPNEVAHVMENSPIGTAVFQTKAIDSDSPDTLNGRIVYSFLNSPDAQGLFHIDSSSGLIVTKGKLDREMKDQYHLVIIAEDLGSLPQIASRVLIVNVTDADDNSPVFPKLQGKEWIELTVEEEAAIGTPVGMVKAIDNDIGPNADIDYKITYGNEENLFAIRRTPENEGEVYVTGRIDREKLSEIKLVVACGKMGQRISDRMQYHSKDPSLLQVLIKVSDLDDNRVMFQKNEYTAAVRVDAPLLTQVLQLRALDLDPSSLPIRYNLINVSITHMDINGEWTMETPINVTEVFILEETSGTLRTSSPLQMYSGDAFHVMVSATSDPTRKPAITQVTVYVLRDADMLRFVFDKNPREVQMEINDFSRQVQNTLPVSDKLNIYHTTVYEDSLGNVDYQKSSSCFQLVGRNINDMKKLFNVKSNLKLNTVFKKFKVHGVESCLAQKSANIKLDFVELWVLVIAVFIGVGAVAACCAACCLYSCYKRKAEKKMQHIRLLESPKLVMGPSPLQPGSITMLPPPPTVIMGPGPDVIPGTPGYEWQEMGVPMDNISYGSVHR